MSLNHYEQDLVTELHDLIKTWNLTMRAYYDIARHQRDHNAIVGRVEDKLDLVLKILVKHYPEYVGEVKQEKEAGFKI